MFMINIILGYLFLINGCILIFYGLIAELSRKDEYLSFKRLIYRPIFQKEDEYTEEGKKYLRKYRLFWKIEITIFLLYIISAVLTV